MKKLAKHIIATLLFAVIASVAYASGTATRSGQGPNMSVGTHEYVQPGLSFSGPPMGGTITNVTFNWNVQFCAYQDPISGQCVYSNAPSTTFLCMSQGFYQTNPPDLHNCVNITNLRSGSTTQWNGTFVKPTNPMYFYFTFDNRGTTGGMNPTWEGRTNTITIYYN